MESSLFDGRGSGFLICRRQDSEGPLISSGVLSFHFLNWYRDCTLFDSPAFFRGCRGRSPRGAYPAPPFNDTLSAVSERGGQTPHVSATFQSKIRTRTLLLEESAANKHCGSTRYLMRLYGSASMIELSSTISPLLEKTGLSRLEEALGRAGLYAGELASKAGEIDGCMLQQSGVEAASAKPTPNTVVYVINCGGTKTTINQRQVGERRV